MILVTGAAGKTGRAVIRALAKRDMAVKAFVRRPEQQDEMFLLGARQVVAGDFGDRSDVENAVNGVELIYHICPNVDPKEVEYATIQLESAILAGVRLFGYHSVLHPQTKQMAHHWQKLHVEEKIFQSGLPFTIIQPCAYMQNVLSQLEPNVDHEVIQLPYSLDAKFSLVDLEDVAAAIAKVLCEPGHEGAIYELAGPEALSYRQIAAKLQAHLNKPVQVEQIKLSDWASNARANGLNEYATGALRSMFEYYDQFGLQGNANVLTYLLGRAPGTLWDFLERELSED